MASKKSQNVLNSRHRQKERSVYVMGGKCQICGYDRCNRALVFHHLNPEEKEFQISVAQTKSWEKVKQELQKCILVCSNCHEEIHAGLIDTTNLKSSFDEQKVKEVDEEIKLIKEGRKKYCERCGKTIASKEARYCKECRGLLQRKVDRPDRETLKEEIRNTPFTHLALKYGVSDNAIRKWCDGYNLPRKRTEINSYTDEEWEKI